jgi:hypothetical protein
LQTTTLQKTDGAEMDYRPWRRTTLRPNAIRAALARNTRRKKPTSFLAHL